jgi:hypothetical protein
VRDKFAALYKPSDGVVRHPEVERDSAGVQQSTAGH